MLLPLLLNLGVPRLYYVVGPSIGWINPTREQIVTGLLGGGGAATAAASQTAPTATATVDLTAVTGLTSGTGYRFAAVWYDGTAYSNVVVSDLLTTLFTVSSDILVTNWVGTPNNTTLFANIDDTIVDDLDYITSPDNSTPAVFGLSNSIPSGSYDIIVRARNTGSGILRIVMLDSSNNVLATSSWQTLTSVYTTYLLNVVLTATASRFRIELSA